jgi:hypothetical protein
LNSETCSSVSESACNVCQQVKMAVVSDSRCLVAMVGLIKGQGYHCVM